MTAPQFISPITGPAGPGGAPTSVPAGTPRTQGTTPPVLTPAAPAPGSTAPIVPGRVPVVPAPPAPVSEAMPTGLGPLETTSFAQMQTDQKAQQDFPDTMYRQRQVLDLLRDAETKYGPGLLGPGTSVRNSWKSFAQSLAPETAKAIGVDPDRIATYDEIKKNLVNLASNRNSQLGGHTDAQLAQTISGTPNVDLSDLSVKNLLAANIALRRVCQGHG